MMGSCLGTAAAALPEQGRGDADADARRGCTGLTPGELFMLEHIVHDTIVLRLKRRAAIARGLGYLAVEEVGQLEKAAAEHAAVRAHQRSATASAAAARDGGECERLGVNALSSAS